jgi:hypothetical protein
MGRRGRNHIVTSYTWPAVMHRLLDAYASGTCAPAPQAAP